MLTSWLYSGCLVSFILVVSRRFVPKLTIPFCESNLLVPDWRRTIPSLARIFSSGRG
uniref:Uncharacterized protein n=1 Tax=Meloidogyne enterolobii TaxID=390850 RepID=A0A6V7TT88_MELEN|nr:unnamed protein product [Meloidogyne enterolobii]